MLRLCVVVTALVSVALSVVGQVTYDWEWEWENTTTAGKVKDKHSNTADFLTNWYTTVTPSCAKLCLWMNRGTQFLDDNGTVVANENLTAHLQSEVKVKVCKGGEEKEVPFTLERINGMFPYQGAYGTKYLIYNFIEITLEPNGLVPYPIGTQIKVIWPQMKYDTGHYDDNRTASDGEFTNTFIVEAIEVKQNATSSDLQKKIADASDLLPAQYKKVSLWVKSPCVLTVDDDMSVSDMVVEGGAGNNGQAAGVVVSEAGHLTVEDEAYFLSPDIQAHDNRNLAYLINHGVYDGLNTYFRKAVDFQGNLGYAEKYGYYGNSADRQPLALEAYAGYKDPKATYEESLKGFQYVSMPTVGFAFTSSPLNKDVFLFEQNCGLQWYEDKQVYHASDGVSTLVDAEFLTAVDASHATVETEGTTSVPVGYNYAGPYVKPDGDGGQYSYYWTQYANHGAGLAGSDYDFNVNRTDRVTYRANADESTGSYFMPCGAPNDKESYTFRQPNEVSINEMTYYYIKNPYPAPIDWRHLFEGNGKLADVSGSSFKQGALGFNNNGSEYNHKTGLTNYDGPMQYGYVQPAMSENRFFSANRDVIGEGKTLDVTVGKSDLCTFGEIEARYPEPVNFGLPYVRFYCEDPDAPKGEGNRSVCVVYFLPYNPVSAGKLPGYANLVNMQFNGQYTDEGLAAAIGVDNAAGYGNPDIYDFSNFRAAGYYGYNMVWEAPFQFNANWGTVAYRYPYIAMHSRYLTQPEFAMSIRAVPLSETGDVSDWTDLRDMFELFVDQRQTRLEYGILDYGNLGTLGLKVGNLTLNYTDSEGHKQADKLSETVNLPKATEGRSTDDKGNTTVTFDYTSTKAGFLEQFPEGSVFFADGNTKYQDVGEYGSQNNSAIANGLQGQPGNIVLMSWSTSTEPCIYQIESVDAKGKQLREVVNRFDGTVGAAPAVPDALKSEFRNAVDGRKYRYVRDDAAGQTLAKRGNVVKLTFEEIPVEYTVRFVDEQGNALANSNNNNKTVVTAEGFVGQKPLMLDVYKKSFDVSQDDGITDRYVYLSDDFDEVELAENATLNVATVTFHAVQTTAHYTVKFVDGDNQEVPGCTQIENVGAVGGHLAMMPSYKEGKRTDDGKWLYTYVSDTFSNLTLGTDEDENIAYVNYVKSDEMTYVVHYVDGEHRELKAVEKVKGAVYRDPDADYSGYTAPFLSEDKLTKYTFVAKTGEDANYYDADTYRLEHGEPTVDVYLPFVGEAFVVPYRVKMVYADADGAQQSLPAGLTSGLTTASGPAVRLAAGDYSAYTGTKEDTDKDGEPISKYVYKGNDFGNVVKSVRNTAADPAEVTIEYEKVDWVPYTVKYVLAASDGKYVAVQTGGADKTEVLKNYAGELAEVGADLLKEFTQTEGDEEFTYSNLAVLDSDADLKIAADGSTEVRVVCTKAGTMRYTVKYVTVSGDDESPVVVDGQAKTLELKGGIGEAASVSEELLADFVVTEGGTEYKYRELKVMDADASLKIAMDGSTVVRVECTKSVGAKYTVAYVTMVDGTETAVEVGGLAKTVELNGYDGEQAAVGEALLSDFEVTEGTEMFKYRELKVKDTDSGLKIAADGSTVVHVLCTKAGKSKYTVAYVVEDTEGHYKDVEADGVAKTIEIEAYAGESVSVGMASLTPFLQTEDGWEYTYRDFALMPSDEGLTVLADGTTKARVKCNKMMRSVPYVVKFVDEAENEIKDALEPQPGKDNTKPEVKSAWKESFVKDDGSVIYRYKSDNSGTLLVKRGQESDNVLVMTFEALDKIAYTVRYRYTDATGSEQVIASKATAEGEPVEGALVKVSGADYSAYQADIVESEAKYVYKSNDFDEVEKTLEGATVTLNYERVPSVPCVIRFRLVGDDVTELKSDAKVQGYIGERLEMQDAYKTLPDKKSGVFTTRYEYASDNLGEQTVFDITDERTVGATGTVRFTPIELCDFTIKYVGPKAGGGTKRIKDAEKREQQPKGTNPVTAEDKSSFAKLDKSGAPTGYQYVYESDDYDAANVPATGVVTVTFKEEKTGGVDVVKSRGEGIQAYGDVGSVTIRVSGSEKVAIYSLSGVKMANTEVCGVGSVCLPAGIYIVEGRSGQVKVVVR